LVEGQDDEYQHHQELDDLVEQEDSDEDVDEEDEEDDDDDEEDDGSDKKRKRQGRKRRSGGGGAKKRRVSYSYNVDDRKAWRKRQVGIDGLTDEERWTQRMSELESFKQRFGHVNVPQKWHENQKLANWLKVHSLNLSLPPQQPLHGAQHHNLLAGGLPGPPSPRDMVLRVC
jgi:hypothetical protein